MFPFPFSFVAPTASGLADIDNAYSMEFDGVDDYMITALDGTSTGGILAASDSDVAVSISFWFKTNNTSSTKGIWQWANQLNDGSPMILFATSSSNNVRFYIDGVYQTAKTVVVSQWYHVVLTRTAADNTWRGYLDGDSTPWFTKDDGGGIGARSSATDIYFGNGYNGYAPCSIDEFAVFDYTLDTDQIEEIYNATSTGKTADLSTMATPPIAWYRMGD
jgi:hypothetical protein